MTDTGSVDRGFWGQTRMRVADAAIAALALLVCPAAADAHLNSTGLGPIYDGLVHFVTSPEDLLAVLALALWAGSRSAGHGRRAMFALPIAWLLGGLVGSIRSAAIGGDAVVSSLWLLGLGGLLAADAKLSLGAATALAACVGLEHGVRNGIGMGSPGAAAAPLLGLDAAVFSLAAIASAFGVGMRPAWARVGMRVVGSWMAAVGLLSFVWAVRGG